jgi:acetolactate synthase-1/2/3 large subunit
MKVSDLVFDFISSKGIDTVFTVSGGGCMHLVDSLGRNSNLQYVCNHHEQACAMAAEGYARIANVPGCILVTTGPGGTNAITGVLCAFQDSIPMIVISGQVPSDQLSNGTGCRQIGQQEYNIVDTVKPMTKYSITVTDKNTILYHLQKAYYLATSGRPGPVWIDIPLDIQSSDVDVLRLKKFKTPIIECNKLKTWFYINKLQSLLNKSKRPVIVVGSGIRASGVINQLTSFLNKAGIPVLTGPHSAVDTVNSDYEFYAGRFGLLGQYTSNHLIQESDLVISLGSRLNPKMIGYDSSKFAPNATKFIVDIDKSEIKKLKFNNKIGWCIDLRLFFDAIQNIQIPDISIWQQKIKEYRNKEKLVLDKHVQLENYVSTYVFANKLEKYLKEDSTIVTSDGTAHVIPLKTMTLKKQQRLFSNEGTAPMGYGLPAAIGAYYGNKKPIICIEGDGSIMMNLQELQTVKHNKIPMKLFIINNDGYLSIKLTQNSFFKGHLVASESSSGVSIPSFEQLAKVFGFKYISIVNNNKIDSVLKDIFYDDEPIIIDVFTDPNEQHEPKVVARGINKDGKIIPGELTNMNVKVVDL